MFRQSGKGKGNAVREGFDVAKGAVLMILDTDLATPPEELPKFYEALKQNKGDFDLLFGAAKLNRKITEIIVRYKDGSMDRPRSAGSDTAGF